MEDSIVGALGQLEISHYSEEAFAQAISKCEGEFPVEQVMKSNKFKYLHQYLHKYPLDKAQEDDDPALLKHVSHTMILEKEYVSNAYLEDFVEKYSKKHKSYPRVTTRIHFFNSRAVELDEFFESIERKEKNSPFWESYLGYIVIKPVPSAMFGASILKVYPMHFETGLDYPEQPRREINSLVNQPVNIFGMQTVINSLAYQEHDKAVGACATNSLWSMFYKTSNLFGTDFPSPYHISEVANRSAARELNIVRDKKNGLTVTQIIKNLEYYGMRWDLYANTKGVLDDTIKRVVYAYNKCGIPLLLGYQMIGFKVNSSGKKEQVRSKHLVTISGYRLKASNDIKSSKSIFYSDSIDRLYVHDDIWGPFAKVSFIDNKHGLDQYLPTYMTERTRSYFEDPKRYVRTHYLGDKAKSEFCLSTCVIAPLEKTIEVRYEEVENSVINFNSFFKAVFGLYDSDDKSYHSPKWEIYISRGSDYKQEIAGVYGNCSRKIFLTNYPLYIWIARLRLNEKVALDLIFDSSDVGSGFCCFQMNFVNDDMKKFLANHIADFGAIIEKAFEVEDKSSEFLVLSRPGGRKFTISKTFTSNHVNFLKCALTDKEVEFYGKMNTVFN